MLNFFVKIKKISGDQSVVPGAGDRVPAQTQQPVSDLLDRRPKGGPGGAESAGKDSPIQQQRPLGRRDYQGQDKFLGLGLAIFELWNIRDQNFFEKSSQFFKKTAKLRWKASRCISTGAKHGWRCHRCTRVQCADCADTMTTQWTGRTNGTWPMAKLVKNKKIKIKGKKGLSKPKIVYYSKNGQKPKIIRKKI